MSTCLLQEAQLRHPDHQWPQHYLGVETDHLQRQPEPGHLLPGQNVHSPSEGLGQSLDQTWELSFCLWCGLQVIKNSITCFHRCRIGSIINGFINSEWRELWVAPLWSSKWRGPMMSSSQWTWCHPSSLSLTASRDPARSCTPILWRSCRSSTWRMILE